MKAKVVQQAEAISMSGGTVELRACAATKRVLTVILIGMKLAMMPQSGSLLPRGPHESRLGVEGTLYTAGS